jgi:hypothetical protein
MTDYNAMLRQLFTAPARGMTAAPQTGQLPGLLGRIHDAIDPVQAMGGYGNLAAMALPPGAPKVKPQLVVARKLPDGSIKYGRPGQTHADLIEARRAQDYKTIDDSQMGFAVDGGPFLSRSEAMDWFAANNPAASKFVSKKRPVSMEDFRVAEDFLSDRIR